jgi:Leucine-rich repeat (LRR) protein
VWSYIDAFKWEFGHGLYDQRETNKMAPLLPRPEQARLWTGAPSLFSFRFHFSYDIIGGETDYYLRWAGHASYERAAKELHLFSLKAKADPSKGRELSLRNHGLHAVPTAITEWTGLVSLDLSYNFISTLPLGLSALADGLESLDLSYNLLTGLQAHVVEALSGMTRLERLGLAHNGLSDLSALPLARMRALVHLDVSHNGLRSIPAHMRYLTRLRHLDMSGNALGGDGTPIDRAGHLKVEFKVAAYHSISPFALGRLHSEAIHPLSSLTTLNLAGNKSMGTVSSRFWANFTQLEVLDFTDCGLTKLPKGIAQLTCLRALHLSDNPKLRDFPSDFWALTSLQELHARYVLRARAHAHTD